MDTIYERHTEEKSLEWFIDTVIVRDIKSVIEAGAGYLSFALMAQAIEYLGALLDERQFIDPAPGVSSDRFALAIDGLFKPINIDYFRYNKANSEFYLYEHLRCGMAHILRPNNRVVFTGKADAGRLGLRHLTEFQPEGNAAPQLLLVVEDLYDDLAAACERAKRDMKRKTNPKLKQGYMTITEFRHSYVNENAPIRLVLETGQKLDLTSPTLSGGPIVNYAITGLAPQAR